MRMGRLLLLASFWFIGCDKSLYDQVTSGGGCRADDTLPGARGRCPNDHLVCELGWFDRDGNPSNGCESQLQAASDYSLFALKDPGLGVLCINEYSFSVDAAAGWAAIAGPACDATPTAPCRYDLRALQVPFDPFRFDGLPWTDFLIELPKPIPVFDSGSGIIIPPGSTFAASFVVDGKKRVVSQGTGSIRIGVSSKGTTSLDVIESPQLPFGGYEVQNLEIRQVGDLVAP